MTFSFSKATKRRSKLRLALIGPAGSGKTWTALTLACGLGQRVALIDTEHGSASKYSDRFAFDAGQLPEFSPATYVAAIEEAGRQGYDVLVIDSLSHAWAGPGGALEMVDRIAARMKNPNNYAAWRDVTPEHNRLVDAIIGAPCHVIATLRSKTAYEIEKDERGRSSIRKVGLQPIQREGLEYEFDVTADMDLENTLVIGKTRCPDIAGKVYRKPTADLARVLAAWLDAGEAPAAAAPAKPADNPGDPPKRGDMKPPKDGKELADRLIRKQAELEGKGQLPPGADALMEYVISAGVDAGYDQDMAKWDGPQAKAGYAWARDWLRQQTVNATSKAAAANVQE